MKNRIFFIVFCFIIIDAFFVVGFLVIRDSIAFNSLKSEVNYLSTLDITKDRFNTKIKSSGDYASVESAIKEYLDNYALEIRDISEMVTDSNVESMLSYDNYQRDGPYFKKSILYLNDTKSDFNKKIDLLISNLDDEYINNYIYNKTKDEFYVSIYKELMFDTSIRDVLLSTKKLLEETKVKMNNIYDTCLDTLNFLSTYNEEWKLEENEIRFANDELLNYYNSLIKNINS